MTRPIAYAYSRYSSKSQADGDSLRRQLEAQYEFAQEHGLELDTSLRDLGVSAYSGDNRVKGAMGSFLRRVQSGEIAKGSYLIVDSLDRLSRESETQVLNTLTGLTLAGIKIVNLAEKTVLDEAANAVDLIRVVIDASRGHLESKEKGRKVRKAHADSKRRAREEGRIWHTSGPSFLERDRRPGKRWRVRKEMAKSWVRAFELADAGLGAPAIARRYNDEGVVAPGGKGWHASTILAMLRNRAVLGEYQPCRMQPGAPHGRVPDGDPAIGYYPAIISEEIFNRVQNRLSVRNKRPGNGGGRRGKDFANLLMGIASCAECGGRMGLFRATLRRPSPHKLFCWNAVRGHRCENRTRTDYVEVERAVLSHFIHDIHIDGAASDGLRVLQESRGAAWGRAQRLVAVLSAGGPAVEQYFSEMDEVERLDADIAAYQPVSRADLKSRRERIETLRTKMLFAEGADLFELRSRLHAELRQALTSLTVNRRVIVIETPHGESLYNLDYCRTGFEGRHPSEAVFVKAA